MALLKAALVVTYLAIPGLSKIVPQIEEEYEICVKPEENAEKFAYSDLQLIYESDTEMFLNGSLKVLGEVKSPWIATGFLERFERGQWVKEGIYKKIPDFCKEIQNPLKPWYKITSKLNPKNCPFPAGTEIKFDMISLTDFPVVFPPNYEGKWRATAIGEFPEEKDKRECMRVHFDMVDK